MADKWRTDARLGALCELVHRTILEAAQLHIPRGWRKLAKCGVVGRCQPDELQDRQSSRAAHPTAQGLKSLEPSQQSGQSRYPREQAGRVAGVCLNTHHLHNPPAIIHRVFKAINNTTGPRSIEDGFLAPRIARLNGTFKLLTQDKEKADAFVNEYVRVNHLKRHASTTEPSSRRTQHSLVSACAAPGLSPVCANTLPSQSSSARYGPSRAGRCQGLMELATICPSALDSAHSTVSCTY